MIDQNTSNKAVYLEDTLETFIYEKQALQFKLQFNINQLSAKNVYFSTVLKELISTEKKQMKQQCKTLKKIISVSMQLEDDLASLDVLQKKTDILKAQVMALHQLLE